MCCHGFYLAFSHMNNVIVTIVTVVAANGAIPVCRIDAVNRFAVTIAGYLTGEMVVVHRGGIIND